MAQTEQVIIDIETMSAESSVKELKDNIKLLRDALVQCQEGTEEYSKIVDALVEKENRLNQVMKAGKSQVEAAKGSYNALVNEMQALKKVWKETTDEVERAKIGQQISAINTQLKDLDASIGNHQRNVGNYTESITAAFSSVGGSSLGLISGIGGIDTAMKALSKNPLMFTFTTLAGIVMQVVNAFQRNEKAMNDLKRATAPFRAAMDGLNEVFDKLASGVATVVGWFTKLMEKYGEMTPEAEAYKQIVEDEIKLNEQREATDLKASENAMEAAELRAKAMDEENYSIQERIEFMQQAAEKELETAELEKQNAELQLSIAQQQLELHKDNKEWIDKVRDAQIELNNATANYNGIVRSTTKEINRLKRQGYSQAITSANELLKVEKELIEQELKLAEEGSKEQLELAKELRKKDYEIQVKGFRDKITNKKLQERAIRLATEQFNKDMEKLETDHQTKLLQIQKAKGEEAIANANGALEKAQTEFNVLVEQYNSIWDTQETNKDAAWAMVGAKNEAEFNTAMRAMRDKIQAARLSIIEAYMGDERQDWMNSLTEMTIADDTDQFLPEDYSGTFDSYAIAYRTFLWKMLGYKQKFDEEYFDTVRLEGESEQEALYNRRQANQAFFDKTSTDRKNYMDSSKSAYLKYVDELTNGTKVDIGKWSKLSDEFMNASPWGKIWNTYGSGKWRNEFNKVEGDAGPFSHFFVVYANEAEKIKAQIKEINETTAQYIKDNFKDAIQGEDESDNDFIQKYWDVLPPDIQQTYLLQLQNYVDEEERILEQRIGYWQNMADGIGSIMGTVADIYKEDIDWQVKQGKITEEEGKKRFESVKKLQISEAIVSTLSGAIGAYMNSVKDIPSPWGIAAGVVQAAAVLASGYAEIQKIRHTEYGSSSSNGSSITSASQPVAPSFTPAYTQTFTGQNEIDRLRNAMSEANLWVNVTDINKAQDKGRVRIAETTF